VLLLGTLLPHFSTEAQSRSPNRSPSSPEAVMRLFFDAVTHERWVEAARLMDTAPLEATRNYMVQTERNPETRTQLRVEELMRADPDMPLAVAEYQVEKVRRATGGSLDPFSVMFANVYDTTTLKQMSELVMGARWLEARDYRYQHRRAWAKRPKCPTTFPEPDSMLPRQRYRVIGTVARRDTAWVLFEARIGTPDRTSGNTWEPPPHVAILRRQKGVWRIAPNELLLGEAGRMAAWCY
jgi:hypothetical protein